jgi:hypothetical protein
MGGIRMTRMRYLIFTVLLFGLSVAGFGVTAQRPEETVASVPALDAFHEVIYKIWHEAWPKKDTALLRQLLPEVEKGIADVASAQLPGILRDKTAAWNEGVKSLQGAGAAYKTAATAKDEAGLLAAAEILHSRFEGLMRTIRPALKELDEFHAVLYMLYHHYLPKNNLEKIRSSAVELKQKMEDLNEAQLPARLKSKGTEFQVARDRLSESVGVLESQVKANNEKAIKEAVEAVHSNYQALERIF